MMLTRSIRAIRAAVATALACMVGGHASAQSILTIDSSSFASGPGAASRVQGALPATLERGVNLDGSPLDADVLPLMLQGNPFASTDGDRWLGPVDFATGSLSVTAVDLSLPARVPWVVGRGYRWSAAGAASDNSPQGRNWFQLSQPELVSVAGFGGAPARLYLVYGPDRFVEFVAVDSDSYKATNGAAGVVRHTAASGSGPDVYEILDARSMHMFFFGGANSTNAAWQIWKIEDPVGGSGHSAFVGRSDGARTSAATAASEGYDSAGRLLYAVDSANRLYSYTYSGNGACASAGGINRLIGVTCQTKTGGTWNGTPTGAATVGEVKYDYYCSGVPDIAHGRPGDLRMVSIITPMTDAANVKHDARVYYRYWVTSGEPVASHPDGAIKLSLSKEGTRRFDWERPDGAHAINWMTATPTTPDFITTTISGVTGCPADSVLQPYASMWVDNYQVSGSTARVVSLWFDGMAGGLESDGVTPRPDGRMTLSYSTSSATNAAGYQPDWRTRTTVKLPERQPSGPAGSTWITQYFDEAGQPLSRVTTDGDPAAGTGQWTANFWANRIERDAGGVVIRSYSPENVTAYAHGATGSTPMFTCATSAGLVTVYDRVLATDSGDPEAAGFLRAVRTAKGTTELSSATYLWRGTYNTGQTMAIVSGGPAVRAVRLATSKSYPTATTNPSDAGDVWSYDYAWWTGTLVVKRATTTQPIVPTSQNGLGSAWSTSTYFNSDGSTAFTKSQAGRLVYFGYDPSTGQQVQTIFDADPAVITTETFGLEAVSLDPTFAQPALLLPALQITTTMEYDAQGRQISQTLGRERPNADAGQPTALRERRAEFSYTRLGDNRLVSINVPFVKPGEGATKNYGMPAMVALANLAGRTEALARIYLTPSSGELIPPKTTTDAPILWINPSAVNPVDALVTGGGANPRDYIAMSTAEFSPTGSRPVRVNRYFNVPTSGMGTTSNFDSSTFDYDNSGRAFRTTDPTHTINRVSFDARGEVARVLRGTNDAAGAGNLRPLADFAYDSNGNLSTRFTYPTGEPGSTNANFPDRRTDWVRDYRGQVDGVINPAEPHVLIGRDNLGRVTSTGLFGGARSEFPTSGPLPAPNNDAALASVGLKDNRLALHESNYDPLGQVYKESTQPINQPGGSNPGDRPGGSGGCDGPIETNNWFGPHGKLKMSAGKSIVKIDYCRDCEIKRILQLAATPTGSALNFEYAKGLDVEHDIILSATVFERSFAPGDSWMQMTMTRYPQLDGGSEFKMRDFDPYEVKWNDDGRITIDNLPIDTPGRLDLMLIDPDELGNPHRIKDYGDLQRDNGMQPTCCGVNCDETQLQPRETVVEPEPRDLISGVIDPLGWRFMVPLPPVARPGFNENGERLRLHIIDFPAEHRSMIEKRDDAGQLLGMLIKDDGNTGRCPEFVYTNEQGRPTSVTPPGATSPMRYGYPDKLTSPLQDSVKQFIQDNTVPVKFTTPDNRTVFERRAADGTLETQIRPNGDVLNVKSDAMGRPIGTDWTQFTGALSDPLLNTPTHTDISYDPLGRVKSVTQLEAGGGATPAINSQVTITRDPYGLPADFRQNPMGAVPIGGSPMNMSFQGGSCAPAQTADGRQGWNGPQINGVTLPGGYPLGMIYTPPTTAFNTPLGEPALDAPVKRVNHLTGPTGETLAVYGYFGIYNPAWMDLPGPNVQNPIYAPTNPAFAGYGLNLGAPLVDNWGATVRDLWQRPTGDGSDPVRPYPPTGFASYLHQERIERDPAGRTTRVFDDAMTWRGDPDLLTPAGSRGFDVVYRRDDCTEEITYCGVGVNPSGTVTESGGYLAQSGPSVTQACRSWRMGPASDPTAASRGNWVSFRDRRDVSPSAATHPFSELNARDSDWSNTFDDGDKALTRKQTTAADPTGNPEAVIQHDADGNCIDNGRFMFKYTPKGELAEVYNRVNGSGAPLLRNHGSAVRGAIFAKFTYNALGWRTSAVYDTGDDANPAHPGAGDGNLNTDTREFYLYDPQWRLVAVFRQGPVGTGGAAPTERPAPRLYERYIYHAQGPRGMGDVRGLDRLVCRHRDADNNPATSLPGMSDGLEETIYYMQNRRGDVVGVLDSSGTLLERVRYTTYGEPQAFNPLDYTNTGEVGPDALSNYIGAYFTYPTDPVQHPELDFNQDGVIDPDDLSSFVGAYFALDPADQPPLSDPTSEIPPGVGSISRPSVDNRFGFAGYLWDKHLGLYHVRHRVYDPYHGRWLQPDPIGYAGGMNLYQYCHGNPVDSIDPSGLDDWWIAAPFYWMGLDSAGEFVNDNADGAAAWLGDFGADLRDQASTNIADAALNQELNALGGHSEHLDAEQVAMNVVDIWDGANSIATFVFGVNNTSAPRNQSIDRLDPDVLSDFLITMGGYALNALAPSRGCGNTYRTGIGDWIRTPYKTAFQDESLAAKAVRSDIQSGVTIYKGGVLRQSETASSQFVATEYPMNPGFAARYGIPPKNADFNFVLGGKLRPGAPVITRVSPGIPPNPGGGIEGVINGGDFWIDWFHMP